MINEIETTQVWYGCYDGGWGNDITSLSYSHPAKISRGLSARIYKYALDRGWLKPGYVVLDPFAGIGGTCLDALANGLSWVGCELERRFTDLGQGCDCTGISKAEWVRFYGRWDKANYKDGRHWCPQCLAQAKQVTTHRGQLSFFEPEPSAAYTRNSGIIPETRPHHYTGNLELFRKYAQPGTWAALLNGDSRNLRAVIGQAVADGLLSSPPYANSLERANGIDASKIKRPGGRNSQSVTDPRYGSTPGQLGGMSEGSLADSLVSSPPFSPPGNNPTGQGQGVRADYRNGKRKATTPETTYGATSGQLGAMSLEGFDAALSSPPFAGNTGGRGEASRNGIDPALFERHSGGMKRGTGDNPANLDHLPMRGFGAALVSLPPFENQNACNDPKYHANRTTNGGPLYGDYGNSTGQLGTEQGQTFWGSARLIVSESYLALKPGSYSFFVCKKFVRDGAIVDFPSQWQRLCEACGFEYVETIRAMLVSRENGQGEMDGGVKVLRKEKKSFFRRLAEKNGSPRIDYEEIIVMRKPL